MVVNRKETHHEKCIEVEESSEKNPECPSPSQLMFLSGI